MAYPNPARAERCEDQYPPRKLNPGERGLHFVGGPEGCIQKCFRCGRILSDEGMGDWPAGTWLEERKANNYTEWTVVE